MPQRVQNESQPVPRPRHFGIGTVLNPALPPRLLIAFLSCLLLAPSIAQSHLPSWRWANPLPHGNTVFDLHPFGSSLLQLCEKGRIYASTDLTNWTTYTTPVSTALRSALTFKNNLLVSGETGTVLFGPSPQSLIPYNLPTTNWIEGLAASSSLAVAVGDNATIYSSADATNWTRRTPPTTEWLRSVTYGAGLFLSVGENGTVLTSTDAITWTRRSSGTTRNLNRVAYLGNKFWIVGDSGLVLSSTSGTGAFQSVNTGATNNLYAIAGTGTDLLITGEKEVRRLHNNVWTSETDATRPAPATPWTYFAAALTPSDAYVLSGNAGFSDVAPLSTATTLSWHAGDDSVRNWLWDVANLQNLHIAVGDHATILTSPDASNWTLELVDSSLVNTVLFGIGGRSNLLVAAGSSGTLLVSANAVTWTQIVPVPSANDLQGVASHKDRILVSGGNGTLLTSTNGVNWSSTPSGTSAFLSGLESDGRTAVATGDKGTLLTSPDGLSWTQQPTGITNWIYRVRTDGTNWVATGENGLILTSTGPIPTTWTRRISGTTRWLNAIAKAGDTWYAAGSQGTLLSSTNLTDWSPLPIPGNGSIYGASSHAGRLVLAGDEAAILQALVTVPSTPVSFLDFQATGGNQLFLIHGTPDQWVQLQSSTDLLQWKNGASLQITDSSGTLLYVEPTSTSTQSFIRAVNQP